MVSWQQGAIVAFKAIMDPELALFLHPWIDDVTSYWWRFLNRTPRETLISGFVDGEVVDSVMTHRLPLPRAVCIDERS